MSVRINQNEVLDPDLPVIDCHHHLFDCLGEGLAAHIGVSRFLLDDYLAYIGDSHKVIASVVVEARTMYRADGPPHLRPAGETEFLNGQAAMAASGRYGPCRVAAGIVGYADLRLGESIKELLEAHIAAAPERFKGIRHEGIWDADESILGGLFDVDESMYFTDEFRQGFAHLAPLGLSFDAFVLSPQLADIADLARAFPDTQIIVNHVGSPVGIGVHASCVKEEYPQWERDMGDIAACPNTVVKLGGLGSSLLGSRFYRSDSPPSVEMLVEEWKPYVERAIELFGPYRCMFESNVPTDGSGGFNLVCNAYKTMTRSYSADERAAIFAGTAARVYRLNLP